MSQILESERPLRLHAGGPEVWKPEENRLSASTAPPASCRGTEGLEASAARSAGAIGRVMDQVADAKPWLPRREQAGANVHFCLAFWFPDLGSTDARSEGAGMAPAEWHQCLATPVAGEARVKIKVAVTL